MHNEFANRCIKYPGYVPRAMYGTPPEDEKISNTVASKERKKKTTRQDPTDRDIVTV